MPSPPAALAVGRAVLPVDGFAISAPPTTTRTSSSTAATAQATSAAVRHGRIERSSCWRRRPRQNVRPRAARSFSCDEHGPRSSERPRSGADPTSLRAPSASDVSGRNPSVGRRELGVEDAARRARPRAPARGPARVRAGDRAAGRVQLEHRRRAMPVPTLKTPPDSLSSAASVARATSPDVDVVAALRPVAEDPAFAPLEQLARGRSRPHRPHRADPDAGRRRCRSEAPRGASRGAARTRRGTPRRRAWRRRRGTAAGTGRPRGPGRSHSP